MLTKWQANNIQYPVVVIFIVLVHRVVKNLA